MKLVIRAMSDDDRLLGWVEHESVLKGDGMLRASGPVVIVMDESGRLSHFTVHWCDVNVVARIETRTTTVAQGDRRPIATIGDPLIRVGIPVFLPPVTVRGAAVAVPTGGVGAGA